DFAVQHGVSASWVRNDPVFGALQKLMNHRSGHSLFDSVALCLIDQSRHGNRVNFGREGICTTRNSIATSVSANRTTDCRNDGERRERPARLHGITSSAIATAFAAASLMLSTAPQIHTAFGRFGSRSSRESTGRVSPAALTFEGDVSSWLGNRKPAASSSISTAWWARRAKNSPHARNP